MARSAESPLPWWPQLKCYFFVCFGAWALQLPVAWAQRAPDAPSPALAKLMGEMEDREAALRELGRQEKSITRALGDLDESIAKMDARVAGLEKTLAKTQDDLSATQLATARITAQMETAEQALRARLAVVMRLGPRADVQMLVGARSMREVLWTRAVLRRVAQEDAALVAAVTERRRVFLEQRAGLSALAAEMKHNFAEMTAARRAAAQTRVDRAATLVHVATQKGAAQRKLEELTAARRRLKGVLDELPPPEGATGFLSLKGALPWPTAGVVDVPFGPKAEAGGLETVHSGISLRAALGQPVTAVAKGRVVYAGWLRGFGQMLIVDHGDGFHTLLAHLSRVAVDNGQSVTQGEVVAFVGDSESLVGPRLYFELRARGRPVDPQKWLTHGP